MIYRSLLYFSTIIFQFFAQINQANGQLLTKNVSSTLDMLLASDRYDKRIRPGFGGPPVDISVNFIIKSMGPVSENDQSFGLDCYFRQHWYDFRLKYSLPGLEEFSLSWLFLDKVWKPDTYFVNGKKSYLHKITAPNKFLRLRYDGFLTYSMRLTISASCPMYLRKFPLDAQRCPLILGSYGYTKDDVVYTWAGDDAIGIAKELELAQFDLVNVTIEHEKMHVRGGHSYSTVQANFWLKRHTGFFMLQVYVPCGLIVLSSWVSFWIDPDDVAARVALGVTTVLSLTTMGFGSRAQLPKVSYWTALDWFVIICFTSVFSVMIEYACVNFLDKVTKDLKSAIEKRRKDQQLEEQQKKTEEATSIVEPTIRKRSASMSIVPTEVEEECRKANVQRENVEKHGFLNVESSILLPALKQRARKLSTTLQEWIGLPGRQDSFTRSVQNLSRLDQGFRDPDMKIPIVVVSEGSEAGDIALDLTGDEVWDEDDEDTEIDNKENLQQPSIWQRLKTIYDLIQQWRFLPQEKDVVVLMDDPTPPDKFSKIDIEARRGFPIAFLTSMLIYIFAFAYYLTDDFPARDTDIMLYRN